VNNSKVGLRKSTSGQALIEAAILIPFLLAIIFNAVNFGYFYYVALNMSAATRSGALYSILGPDTPVDPSKTFTGSSFAPAGSTSNCVGSANCTVSYVMYQDMAGALPRAASRAVVKVCTQSLGTTTTGGIPQANCQTFASSSASGVSAGQAPADPEASAAPFILHQVDVTYTFNPLIPSTAFSGALLAFSPCTPSGGSVSCTFHRKILMRAM
jgi:Flp pilus assembly protein TadG